MSKRAIAIVLSSLLTAPVVVHADAWTDGQAEWARHGSRHGAWDCDGRCPEGRKAASREHSVQRRPSRDYAGAPGGSFDGAWAVAFGGSCQLAGTSQVVILGHRISGQGLVGSVSSSGIVHTLSTVNGVSVIGDVRIYGASAAGSYRQSDGCSGGWSAYRQ